MRRISLFLGIVVSAAGIVCFSQGIPSFAQLPKPLVPDQIHSYYLPVIQVPTTSLTPIIVDHRHTDIQKIPSRWVLAARELSIHYAHTSHGSQVLSGLEWLEGVDGLFTANIQVSGALVHPNLPESLNIYDGNNYSNSTYITPEMYWESTDGVDKTESVVSTGWFNLSMWTWCGQMSFYSQGQVQQYLDTLTQLSVSHPQVRFILFTGHTDGSAPGSTLWNNNQLVRQWVQQHGGILFDFADIESYDPSGNYHPDGSDACDWCEAWCDAHPTEFACQAIPSNCAHTHGLQCTLKGQAFWWMLARLAGWDEGAP